MGRYRTDVRGDVIVHGSITVTGPAVVEDELRLPDGRELLEELQSLRSRVAALETRVGAS